MAKGMNRAQAARTVGNVAVTLLDTGEVFDLKPRSETACVFVVDRFPAGEYMVQLRLDFGDLDERGNPTLDADFFRPGSTKPDRTMQGHPAHHTAPVSGPGPRTYEWTFEDVEVRFTAAVTWQLTMTTEATSGVSITGSVTRATVTHEDGTID